MNLTHAASRLSLRSLRSLLSSLQGYDAFNTNIGLYLLPSSFRYDAFHLNFAGALPRHLLEQLARLALDAGSVDVVSKVFDQYVLSRGVNRLFKRVHRLLFQSFRSVRLSKVYVSYPSVFF